MWLRSLILVLVVEWFFVKLNWFLCNNLFLLKNFCNWYRIIFLKILLNVGSIEIGLKLVGLEVLFDLNNGVILLFFMRLGNILWLI